MANPLPQTMPSARQQRHYRLTHQEWQADIKRFKYAEIKILYYLRTLDPFGDRWIRIRVSDIARELNMSRGTVSDALKVLAEVGELDLEISTAKVRLNLYRPKPQEPESQIEESEGKQSDHKGIAVAIPDRHSEQSSLQRTKFATTNKSTFIDEPEPAQGKDLENAKCTNCFKDFKQTKQTGTEPTPHPVLPEPEIDKGELGTTLQALHRAEIPLNKSTGREINQRLQAIGEAATISEIKIAISVVEEERKKGNLRNPGGLFVAAMRRGFTANELKQKKQSPKLERVPPPLQEIQKFEFESAIDRALFMGDRTFALDRLQRLWSDGRHDYIKELLKLRRDWNFRVRGDSIEDKQNAP